ENAAALDEHLCSCCDGDGARIDRGRLGNAHADGAGARRRRRQTGTVCAALRLRPAVFLSLLLSDQPLDGSPREPVPHTLKEQSMAASWTPDQPIVQCVDVRKSFGALEVLKGISLS